MNWAMVGTSSIRALITNVCCDIVLRFGLKICCYKMKIWGRGKKLRDGRAGLFNFLILREKKFG